MALNRKKIVFYETLGKGESLKISELAQLQNHIACFAFSVMEERKSLSWDWLYETYPFMSPDRN